MDKFKDDYIKKKFENDNFIPSKVNNVFEDFKKNSSKYIVSSTAIKEPEKNITNKKQNEKVISFFTYKNINKLLSVAAVFLCVVLVGMGTLLKNRPTEIENIEILKNDGYRYGSLNYIRSNGKRINWISDYYKKLKRK